MHAYKIKNGVLHNGQRMAFLDQGEFEAIKMLSSWEAARRDEHPFQAKIKVSA